jgi:hypothetical protein
MSMDYIARISGTWNPGSVPPLDGDDLYAAQQEMRRTIATMLGLAVPQLDFHIISTMPGAADVLRTRWRLTTRAGGPTLFADATEPHPSDIYYMLRLAPLSQVKQIEVDVAAPEWPYRGILTGAIPAVLLREAWGTGARQINVGAYGTGLFTPTAVTFTSLDGFNSRTAPFEQEDFADFPVEADDASAGHQSVWLVVASTDGGAEVSAHKLSYAIKPGSPYDVANRWDDPAEPAPDFTPLVWSGGVEVE